MAGELKLNNVSVATESGGTVTIAPNNITFAANHAGIKTALNASGNPGVYAARAWVNFNGTGTISITSSGNVSSLTDNGTGDYTITFQTAMPDTNYSVVALNSGYNCNESTSDRSNSAFAVESWYASSIGGSKALVDGTISIIVIR